MKDELADEIRALIEARLDSCPTPMEFEMAYQGRVAIDRIRFAINHTEQFAPHTDQMRDANLQLLDALQRLESADRRFQAKSRSVLGTRMGGPKGVREGLDGDELHTAGNRDHRTV